MNRSRWTAMTAAGALMFAAACDNSTNVQLATDAEITADVAASAGDAMALSVSDMIANETGASLSSVQAPGGSNLADNSLAYSRTRTCYDVNGAVVAGCTPLSSVITVVTMVQLDGTRSGSNPDATRSWSGAVHRVATDSLTRVFVSANETQRVHNNIGMAHDTTTFTGADVSRFFAEAALDSVKMVTFNLPRSSNPWPVSGSIVRVDTVHAIFTKGTNTDTRSVTRRIVVTFPADAQGNVSLTINATACTLNLVTRKVSNCA